MGFPVSLVEANLYLLHEAPHHDCEIKCSDSDVTFAAHKSILCSRNRYFSAALAGTFQEANNKSVVLDDAPFAVEGFLVFLYTLQYPSVEWIKKSTLCSTYSWEFDFEMFKIADKRQAPELLTKATDVLVDLVNSEWDEGFAIKIIPGLWSIHGTDADVLRKQVKIIADKHHVHARC